MSKKGNPTPVITIAQSGNTVWANVMLAHDKKLHGIAGAARCHPNDTFDFYEGARIALARAFERDPFPKPAPEDSEKDHAVVGTENLGTGKWVHARFKASGEPGSVIRIDNPWKSEGLYKKGDLLKIKVIDVDGCGCYVTINGKRKFIANQEYSIWVPENSSSNETKTGPDDNGVQNAGHWVRATIGNLGLPGDLIRIDEPYMSDGLYKRGDVLAINAVHPSGCLVHFANTYSGKKLILAKEYSIWVPTKAEKEEQKISEESKSGATVEHDDQPLIAAFRVGDIVKTGAKPFDPTCRNRPGIVRSVTPLGKYHISYDIQVVRADGTSASQTCSEHFGIPAPMTLLLREGK